jgi:methylmalonyl-CoA mutase N-terminal domain/subunit
LRPPAKRSAASRIEPVYTADDIAGLEIPPPGEFPYTRGIHESMYRGKLWTMRQFSGFATPEETNRRYLYLLSQGQTGLSVAFDLPTLMGYDADHRRRRAKWASAASPSARSKTWRFCSAAFRSAT